MIQRRAQRTAPLLVPAFTPGVATTIAAPAFHAVITAPRRVFHDLHFQFRWMLFQELSVIGETDFSFGIDLVQGEGQRHVAILVVVTVSFAIGSNVHQLWPGTFVRKAVLQSIGKGGAIIQQLLERHRLRDWAVIKEEVDPVTRGKLAEVSAAGIDAATTNVLPTSTAQLAYTCCLMLGQHSELDSFFRQRFKTGDVRGGFL